MGLNDRNFDTLNDFGQDLFVLTALETLAVRVASMLSIACKPRH